MKTIHIIILLIIFIFFLSFIDRFLFRKIVISNREKLDDERFKITATTHLFFNLIKRKFEYVEIDGKFYTIHNESPYSTKKVVDVSNEVDPMFVKKALLKYKLENGLNS